ncbi:hypothetical protein Agub_g13613, partial [Astrephomene gubernaculifera]
MPIRMEGTQDGSTQPADAIQAFCRHLGELCDVLTAPYNAEALERAASGQDLQGTTCNLLLQNALYQWLGERVQLSMGDSEPPEEATRRARESALSTIRNRDLLTEFVQTVAHSLSTVDPSTQAPTEPARRSLLFDLHGPLDLLGPEEVESLLAELTSSDAPLSALQTLSSDPHLLEDLCFGHDWHHLCDALGRLACLPPPHPHTTPAAANPQHPHPHPQPHPQQQNGGEPEALPSHAQPAPALHRPHNHSQPHENSTEEELLLVEDTAAAAGSATASATASAQPASSRQHQLLLAVLQEVVACIAASSPPHAAELLDSLAPALTALVVQLPQQQLLAATTGATMLPPADSSNSLPGGSTTLPGSYGSCSSTHHGSSSLHGGGGGGGGGLLEAAAAVDPFAVDLTRVAHQLLSGLAQEFHTLPLHNAALAARAVCDVVRAGIARGAPAVPVVAASSTSPSFQRSTAAHATAAHAAHAHAGAATAAAADPMDLDSGLGGVVELSALDLLVLLDPELRWWQRLCAATHATQRMAEALASTQLPVALESALAAWAAAAAAASASAAGAGAGSVSGFGRALGGVAGGSVGAGGRSPTHLLACTALLAGLVRANNPALLGMERAGSEGSGGGDGAGGGAEGEGSDGGGGWRAAAAAGGPQAPPGALAAAPQHQQQHQQQRQKQLQQQHRVRLQRLLGHLTTCFCALADKPYLLRPGGVAGPAPPNGAAAATLGAGDDAEGAAGYPSSKPSRRRGGSVFLRLASDALAAAAALGALSAYTPSASGSAGGGGGAAAGGGSAPLALLLQAVMRATSLLTSTAAGARTLPSPASGMGTAPAAVAAAAAVEAEVEAWLVAAMQVLSAVAEHALVGLGSGAGTSGGAASGMAQQHRTIQQQVPLSVGDAMSALLSCIGARIRSSSTNSSGSGSGGSGCVGVAHRDQSGGEDGSPATSAAPSHEAVPIWTRVVVRCAVPLAASSPTVAAALEELYEIVHAVLSKRRGSVRTAADAPPLPSPSTGRDSACVASHPGAGGGGVDLDNSGAGAEACGGLTATMSLLDILNAGDGSGCGGGAAAVASSSVPGKQCQRPQQGGFVVSSTAAVITSHRQHQHHVAIEMDGVECLAAEAVLSYCRTMDCSHVDDSVCKLGLLLLPTASSGASAASTAAAADASEAQQRLQQQQQQLAGMQHPPPQLPAALRRRQTFLNCAARWLCRMYDSAACMYGTALG